MKFIFTLSVRQTHVLITFHLELLHCGLSFYDFSTTIFALILSNLRLWPTILAFRAIVKVLLSF